MSQEERKPIKVLVMSVGEYVGNTTIKYFERIGGANHCTVCLPLQFKHNAESYRERGIDVFLYDEKRYINDTFEFFGFRPRNCGGVGRQGIAEATEKYGDDYLCVEIDDDTSYFCVKNYEDGTNVCIKKWENFAKLIYAHDEFYRRTHIECMSKTGATIYNKERDTFVANRKIFNNFIMHKGVQLNYTGFAALCSDDQRFNIYRNLIDVTPMISNIFSQILFNQNQGDRKDGNAVLYNSDCSWKKSFALKMMMPHAIAQKIVREENRVLFREHIMAKVLYPPIMLYDNQKRIVGVLRRK